MSWSSGLVKFRVDIYYTIDGYIHWGNWQESRIRFRKHITYSEQLTEASGIFTVFINDIVQL